MIIGSATWRTKLGPPSAQEFSQFREGGPRKVLQVPKNSQFREGGPRKADHDTERMASADSVGGTAQKAQPIKSLRTAQVFAVPRLRQHSMHMKNICASCRLTEAR